MIQQVAAYAPDPSFGDPVLSGTPSAGPNRLQAAGLQKPAHLAGELAVAIEHDVAVWRWQRKAWFANIRFSGNGLTFITV